MPKTYFTYFPAIEGSLEEELKLCLDQVENTCLKGFVPVKLNIFTDLPDHESFLKERKNIAAIIKNTFRTGCPAFNITVQPPEKPLKIVIEGTFISKGYYSAQMKMFRDIPYVLIDSDEGKELWAAGVSSYSLPGDTAKAAGEAFSLMNEILASEGMSFDNLVRQWNYIGNILETKNNCQNYQIFNEVRNDFYTRLRKVKSYPAATGVGMMHGGVILDFCALSPGDSTIIKPVENPHQLNAYDYGRQVLKGAAPEGNEPRHAPQFERALLIANHKEAVLHISGTASIIGQETVGKDDIAKQTIVTINNMRLLSDAGRIKQMIPSSGAVDCRFSLLRVYVKRDGDFKRVREICLEHFPGVPAIFIRADICRDDLLMEVEAEAVMTL